MKSERRHELRENDLAHALTVTRDFFEQHSKQITMVAVGALALFAISTFVMRSRDESRDDIWRQKNALNFEGTQEGPKAVDQLLSLVEKTSDTRFAMDGLVEAGRQALRLSREAPFPPDRELNNKARRAFEALLARFPRQALPAGVALAGLATVEENEFVLDHNPAHKDKAKELLTRLSSDPLFQGMPYQRIALDRLKSLDSVFQVTEFMPPAPPPPPEPAAVEPEVQVDPVDQP